MMLMAPVRAKGFPVFQDEAEARIEANLPNIEKKA